MPLCKRRYRFIFVVIIALAAVSCGREAPVFAPGNLTVTSTPAGAAIFVNGADTGEITPHTFAGLEANLYDVTVQLTDFISNPGHLGVDLAPLDDLTLSFTLSQTGLLVTSQPAGARVFIDGTDTGQFTPATVGGLAPGAANVSLALDTYLITPAEFTVEVVAGVVTSVPADAFALEPQRTVILEGFANVDCIPCPQLTDNLVSMAAKPEFSTDRFLYLEYSVSWPNFTDPLFLHNPAENTDRFTDYLVLGAPAVYADGIQLADALDGPAMEAAALADLATDPGFGIRVSADFPTPAVPVTVTLTHHAHQHPPRPPPVTPLADTVPDRHALRPRPGRRPATVRRALVFRGFFASGGFLGASV